MPPVGARPSKGFCGLKNAGATCYMNSVLQQLYMVPSIRVGILKAEGAAVIENEDFSGEPDSSSSSAALYSEETSDIRKNYHVVILKHVQAIFAHLGHSALQYYVPRGLWTHFKYVVALPLMSFLFYIYMYFSCFVKITRRTGKFA